MSRGGRLARTLAALSPALGLVAVIWVAHGLNIVLDGGLTERFGLIPRRLEGIDGVVAMPLLHADLDHLIGNSGALLALGLIIAVTAPQRFVVATLGAVILGGALLWLVGRPANHIGASGLIFGWFGFLVAYGALSRSWRAVIGAALAIAVYGATVFAALGGDVLFGGGSTASTGALDISWEAHLCGLVGGLAAAWIVRPRPSRSRALRRPKA